MTDTAFGSSNSTRSPATMSWFTAMILLRAFAAEIEALRGRHPEDAELMRNTLREEITHLAAWMRQHPDYDFESELKELDEELESVLL